MPLITCPDCGKQISDSALTCPNCGRPMMRQRQNMSSVRRRRRRKRTTLIIVFIVIALLLIGGIAAIIVFKPWDNNDDWIETADKSVVKITCFDYANKEACSGSGFVFFDDETIVTNYHVIEGMFYAKVTFPDGKRIPIRKIDYYDEDMDIAVLTAKYSLELEPLKAGDSTAMKKGDKVIAIGSPLGLQNVVSDGMFSGRTDGYIQLSAPISSGSSGGALFNEKGEVIGVTSAGFDDGQNLNLAVPIENVIALRQGQKADTTMEELAKKPYEKIPLIENNNGSVLAKAYGYDEDLQVFVVKDKNGVKTYYFEVTKEEYEEFLSWLDRDNAKAGLVGLGNNHDVVSF